MTRPVPVPDPASPEDPRRPLSPGYTVVELLVTLALTSVIVLASLALVEAAARVALRTDRALDSPRLVAVTTSLRRDFHRSVAIGVLDVGWQNGPLVLAGWDGGRVEYLLDGDRLVREASGALGAPSARRVLTLGISSWWWRPLDDSTVEIRLTAAPPQGPRRSTAEPDTLTRRFAVRGWPDGRSW